MISLFFKKFLPADPPNVAIDNLENNNAGASNLTFDILHHTKHGNTFLLQALAWNRLTAAKKIIDADVEKKSLNQKDSWPTCHNTPIILAAKINATKIIQQLIRLEVNLNHQDYRGFTALHYACILRNDDIIEELLAAGAETTFRDAFGNLALDYYKMEILVSDLHYRYGFQSDNVFLNPMGDIDNSYFGTRKPCLSALRWYLAHIIINSDLGLESYTCIDKEVHSIHELAASYLYYRNPVDRKNVYNKMIDCFCESRLKISPKPSILNQLQLDTPHEFCVEYSTDFRINQLHLVSPSQISYEENELNIELEEFQSYSMI